ncbi:MAG: hypothetical protein P8Y64_07640 [Gammaproteobacteria bacterium]|jgi:hypothetical protein
MSTIHAPLQHRRRGGCGGPDPARRERHQHDRDVFHQLLDSHEALRRRVVKLDNGIRATTTSPDPQVVALLHDHVPAMHARLEENFPLRRWDRLYAELFRHRDKIDMQVTLLPNGVEVTETSRDPEVVKLIHAHGDTVDAFVRGGYAAAANPSPVPRDYRG